MNPTELSRRGFLRTSALVVACAAMAGCTPSAPKQTVAPTKQAPAQTTAEAKPTVKVEAPATKAAAIKGELLIWTYPKTDNDLEIVFKPLMAKFHEQFPDIKTTVDVLPWRARREQLYTAFAAGAPPDIWYSNTDTLPAYAEKKLAVPLNDLIAPRDMPDYTQVELGACTWEGKQLIALHGILLRGFLYNATLMKQCGVDPQVGIKTWDEALALGEAAKSKGLYRTAVALSTWQYFVILVHQAGGKVFAADNTKTLLLEQPAVDALTFWVTEFQKGYIPKEYAVGSEAAANQLPNYWAEGKQVVAIEQAPQGCATAKEVNKNFDYAVGYPMSKGAGQKPFSSLTGGEGWSITKLSKNQAAAVEWIKFMIKPENLALWCTLTGHMPPGTAVPKFWKPTGDPCIQTALQQYGSAQFFDNDCYFLWQEGKVTCMPHFQAAVLGTQTIRQALENSHKELTALIKEKSG